MSLILHDLALREGRRPSPYCWRAKYALAHKGLTFEARPIPFTGIPRLYDGSYKTVPILEDAGQIIADSWAIADHLDARYPDRPQLFANGQARALCRFIDAWAFQAITLPLLPRLSLHIHDAAEPEDQAYYRTSREQRLGRSLEALAAGASELSVVREGFAPLRLHLTRDAQPFLSGAAPGFADFIAVSPLLWAASVTSLPLLQADDPLTDWYARMRDACGGVGHGSTLHSLAQ